MKDEPKLMDIEKEAKQIMDNFVKALNNVKHGDYEYTLTRKHSMREPKETIVDKEFTTCMLKNAPEVKNGCIKAEKKKW